MNINNIKPILNGNEIQKFLPNIPKRFFKLILDILIKEQIEERIIFQWNKH